MSFNYPEIANNLYSHKLGQYVCNPAGTIGFINIPKNGSTDARIQLIENNWTTENINNGIHTPARFLVVLRDPVERWISGLIEFCQRSLHLDDDDILKLIQNPHALKLMTNGVMFDAHTAPQSLFLDRFDFDTLDFMWLNPLLTSQQNRFDLTTYCNIPSKLIKQQANMTDINLSNTLKQLITAEDIETFKHFYSNDYKLIEKVSFIYHTVTSTSS